MKVAQLNRNYIFLFMALLFVVFSRMADINFIDGRYLWAEDGNIFITQAYVSGLSTLTEPHAGYLHLYPRIVALLSIQFPLSIIPTLFFISWFSAVIFTSFVVFNFIYKNTQYLYLSFLLPILILTQPHSGETFFTVTNAQWFLAIALFVFLIDEKYKINKRNFSLILILGLTGPFSILLLPILFLNVFIKKDLKDNYLKYFLIILTAFIQIYFMIQSNRISGQIDINIVHWIKSFYVFITFGTKGFFAILSILIWTIVSIYFIKLFYDLRKKELSNNQINGFLIIIGLFIIYFAGLWTYKQDPLSLHPLGGGARYYVIPYALFLISIFLLIKQTRVLYVVILMVLIIDIKQFKTIDRKSLNFQSFAWFSEHISSLNIPINPQWSYFPGPSIQFYNKSKNQYDTDFERSEELKVESINELNLQIPKECNFSKHLGIEIRLIRSKDGWGKIKYSNQIIKRYFEAGDTIMYFAIPLSNEINEITFNPSETNNTNKLNYIILYCDDKNKNAIKIVKFYNQE